MNDLPLLQPSDALSPDEYRSLLILAHGSGSAREIHGDQPFGTVPGTGQRIDAKTPRP